MVPAQIILDKINGDDMNTPVELDGVDLAVASLEREWRVTIQCPAGGVAALLDTLGSHLPLRQGAYDNCMYVRQNGYQRFRALEGSHAGSEGTIQTTEAAEIVFTIAADLSLLKKTFEVVFEFGVQEDPTIHIEQVWGSRSKYLDDKDNPNRYWNRADADEIHGSSSPAPIGPD